MLQKEIKRPPISYLIRHSKRAKHISMSISPKEGLEVVLPPGHSTREAEKFIQENKKWLVRHADLLNNTEKSKFTIARDVLPEMIQLKCLNQTYQIQYRKTFNKTITCTQVGMRLLEFSGSMKDFRACEPSFYEWLKSKAAYHLPIFMERLSQETKFQYRKIHIRHQKTRWGSCSVQGDISLNIELLLLPFELARYLMIHELYHLKEFNHSKRFWKLVEKFEPNYEELKNRLKTFI